MNVTLFGFLSAINIPEDDFCVVSGNSGTFSNGPSAVHRHQSSVFCNFSCPFACSFKRNPSEVPSLSFNCSISSKFQPAIPQSYSRRPAIGRQNSHSFSAKSTTDLLSFSRLSFKFFDASSAAGR